MSAGCKCRPVSVKQNLKKLKQMWMFLNILYVTV